MWRQAARSARPGRRSAPVRWRAAVLRTARLPWYSPFPQPIWASADLALAVAGQGAVVVRKLGPVSAGPPQGGVVPHVDIDAHHYRKSDLRGKRVSGRLDHGGRRSLK